MYAGFGLVVLMLLLAPAPALANPVTSVCITALGDTACPTGPATVTGITQGVDFTLQLLIDGAVDVGDFFIDGITWSSSQLSLISATDAGTLGPCASSPCFQYDASVPGALSFISFYDFGASHSFTGSGALALLRFRPLLSGTFNLAFSGFVLLGDSAGIPLLLDVNGDPTLVGQGATVVAAPASVPEPGTLMLVGAGLAGLFARRRSARPA